MRKFKFGLIMLLMPLPALAAEASAVSPTTSLLKMVVGLAIVLALMVLISWVAKRLLPRHANNSTAIKMVGGVNVGAREKVVVLEVSGRWLVVGVAQGHVSAIADLEAGADQVDQVLTTQRTAPTSGAELTGVNPLIKPMVKPFSTWLQKSMHNMKSK